MRKPGILLPFERVIFAAMMLLGCSLGSEVDADRVDIAVSRLVSVFLPLRKQVSENAFFRTKMRRISFWPCSYGLFRDERSRC